MASSIKDIHFFLPEAFQETNHEGIINFLNFGFFLGTSTFHTGIKRSLPLISYKWDCHDGLKSLKSDALKIPQVKPGKTLDAFVKSIGESIKKSIINRCCFESSPLSIGLSGGFDSRLLAGFCLSEKIKIKAYTYGKNFHSETLTAIEIAKALGIEQHILKYPKDLIFEKIPEFLDILEGHADLQVAQIFNLLSTPEQFGNRLMHGYLGGPLSGLHLGSFENKFLNNIDGITESIFQHFSNNITKENDFCLGIKINHDKMMHQIYESLDMEGLPYQSITKWMLLNTQRDNIGSTLRILGSHFKIITPLYDKFVIENFQTLPLVALKNRFIFREIIRTYFPNLARIPHSEEYYSIIPNLQHILKAYLKNKKNILFSNGLNYRKKYRMYAEKDYIWSLSHGGSDEKQRSFLLKRLSELSKSIQAVFGLDIEKCPEKILYKNGHIDKAGLEYLRRVFTIGIYSDWLLKMQKQ